jgi:protein-tyrosine-phosphatase
MARVLFVCVRNAGRSQMSQALFNRAADGTHEARSAGSEPIDRVHPEVIAEPLKTRRFALPRPLATADSMRNGTSSALPVPTV